MSDEETPVDLLLDLSEPHQLLYTHRRVRHISSIQIRNLTPFPARDAFASALLQPAEQSQFSSPGHHSDDLDISLTMKRSRRISVNSVTTMRSIKSEDTSAAGGDTTGTGDSVGTMRGRTRAESRASTIHSMSSRTGAGSAPTMRPRNRTSSNASSMMSTHPSNMNATTFVPLYQDHTQASLEKVITTRLVETFLSITVKPPNTGALSDESGPSSPTFPSLGKFSPHSPTSPLSPSKKTPTSKVKKANGAETPKGHRASASSVERVRIQDPPSPRHKAPTHSKSASTSSPRTQTLKPFPGSSSTGPSTAQSSEGIPIPDFLSAIHPPSTNPLFPIDASKDFASWTDLSGEEVVIEIWVKEALKAPSTAKGKERSPAIVDEENWKLLTAWNFDLSELVPLSEDLLAHLSQLPSNTLLITLDPPGRSFYLSTPRILRNRSPSPSAGYASDPETSRKVPRVKNIFPSSQGTGVTPTRRRYRRGTREKSHSPELAKTAGWQDLFKLVSLQTCIRDTKASLDAVISGIDKAVQDDASAHLIRQIQEREARLHDHQNDLCQLKAVCQERDGNIRARRDKLRQRRETLLLARELLREGMMRLDDAEQLESEERARLDDVRGRITPTRTTLLSILAWVFPIELRSPPDLLFTILDVPLPIPLAATDPAPPFSLLAHKDINEDIVATALGYAAHVVHFIALYLGKGLVYPVTYVGSRSMIRDGISAMVGPRMFPLFSKGVDTYRFEYGVFLLNKDIELLMAEQDLRALDMRHTLPNLKNLLLTLTSGEGLPLCPTRPTKITSPVPSGLESPRPESPVGESPATPKASDAEVHYIQSGSPPASGATTPTETQTIKKRAFMNLNPLSSLGFLSLRRYPSTLIGRSASDGVDEVEDEDDRRTIHGGDAGELVQEEENGNGNADIVEGAQMEKVNTGLGVETDPTMPVLRTPAIAQ